MKHYDIIVIGGGPAGLAAATAARREGTRVLLLERESALGGILKQCIHDGFGLHRFQEKLSGPEYAERCIREFTELGIDSLLSAFVTAIDKTEEGFLLHAVTGLGVELLAARALVLATGCRERTPRQAGIHGTRPAGILTAGSAQYYCNILGQKIGRKAVILGSGDIGLIMARRLTLEGTRVLGVYEIMPNPSGLPRNVRQCLQDFSIPLHLSETVTAVYGSERVEEVVTMKVGPDLQPIPGTEQRISCDTLIVSVGLLPENELAEMLHVTMDPKTRGPVCDMNYQTDVPGVFSCGNSYHVFDLADFVSESGDAAGKAAAAFLRGKLPATGRRTVPVPVKKPFAPAKLICIGCPKGCTLEVTEQDGELLVTGNSCPKGRDFAIREQTAPERVLCTTVRTVFPDMPVLPVRTSAEVPRSALFDLMKLVNGYVLDHSPEEGEVLIKNLLNTGADLIATATLRRK